MCELRVAASFSRRRAALPRGLGPDVVLRRRAWHVQWGDRFRRIVEPRASLRGGRREAREIVSLTNETGHPLTPPTSYSLSRLSDPSIYLGHHFFSIPILIAIISK